MPVNKILELLLAFVMLSSEAYACQSPPMPTEKNISEFFSQVHIFAKKHHDSVIVDVSFPSTYKGKELLWVHMGSDSDRKSNNFHTRMHVENNVTFSALVGESLLPEVSFNFTYGSCGYAFVLEGREVLDGL